MAEVCICGNVLQEHLTFKMTSRPCKCEDPKSEIRVGGAVEFGIPPMVFEKQWEERKRLGLPIRTDTEIGMRSRWT